MKWSRGPKRIFDGGAVGRDAVNVLRADRSDVGIFQPYSYEDVHGAPLVSPPTQESPARPSPSQTPTPAPGLPPDEVEAAVKEAFERGVAEGQRNMDEHLARLAEQLEGAMEFFHTTLNRVDDQASRQTLELALMVAEQLFRRSIEVDPDRLLAAVGELVAEADEGGTVRIMVDPATAKRWRAHQDALKELLTPRNFEVEAKPDLSVGDLIVHCGSQTLDERVANRVRQYARALEAELGMTSGD